MQTEQWDRIRELFDEVSRQPAHMRAALLDQLCPEDSEVRQEVLSLLGHNDRAAPSFLTPPPAPNVPLCEEDRSADEHDPLIGSRLGKYLIRRVIARGGMGTVYEAEQEHPRRTVAVKVMHAWTWSRNARRRFEFEVQALARLTHPNIAQIFDADTISLDPSHDREGAMPVSLSYFVMEYVAGAKTITDYADEEGLSSRQQLELFLHACDAVHYGHQKGIIHRDLKPANILVGSGDQPAYSSTGAPALTASQRTDPPSSPSATADLRLGKGGGYGGAGVGVVKVIDFGVAKATDADVAAATMHTDVGQLIGTLTYMSPEQCAADPLGLDVRCDVYSLGVVLYQLVCRRLPYAVPMTSLTSAARVICEEPPTRPSTIDRSLRGDLEAILLKAIEKEPAKRYQSIADLARDVRRYLNREPIDARAPSLWSRTARWMTRHPLLVTTGSATCVGAAVLLAFFVSIQLAHLRPYRILVQNDGREAVLLSFSGNPLFTWRSPVTNGIKAAALLDEPDSAGRRMVLIGFEAVHPGPRRGSLCAFDVEARDYEDVSWQTRIEPGDIPRDEPEFKASDFSLAAILAVDDVFDGEPGPEIIASFGTARSRRALRIISSWDGRVLYQVWHDGAIHSAYWLRESKILVLAGTNDEVPWNARGGPVTIHRPNPWVVWAVPPELGQRFNRYVCPSRFARCTPPIWYRCVLPPEATDVFADIRVEPPIDKSVDDGTHFLLAFTYEDASSLRDRNAEAGWIIDATGNVSDRVPYKDDYYLQDQARLRPIEDFRLADLPPITARPD